MEGNHARGRIEIATAGDGDYKDESDIFYKDGSQMTKIKMTRLVRGRSAGARSLTKIVTRQSGAQAGHDWANRW